MPPAKDFGESDEEAEKGPNVANHLKREKRRGPSQTKIEDQGSWLTSTPKGACMYICKPRTSRRKRLLAYRLQRPKLCSFSRP